MSFSDYFDLDALDGPIREASISLPSTPLHAPHSQFIFNSDQSNGTPIDELLRYNESSSDNVSHGFPMMREVSLYRGLPNGWQYQNMDYESAYAELVEYQRMAPLMPYDPSLGRTRPRIPDIVPLFMPDFDGAINREVEESESVLELLGEDYNHKTLAHPQPDDLDSHSPIDPFLLALASSIHSPSLDYESPKPSSRRFPLSNIVDGESGVRVPPPSSASSSPTPNHHIDPSGDIGLGNSVGLHIDYLDSVETFQDLYTVRVSANEDNNRLSGKNSPASSVGSDASGLSLVSGMRLGYGILSPTSISSTPTTTAPVTPIDEVPVVKEDGINGLDGGGGDRLGEESEEDLKAVIQGVSVCGVRA
jgi:hypothetical protein